MHSTAADQSETELKNENPPEFDLWKINPETDFKMNPQTESLSVR